MNQTKHNGQSKFDPIVKKSVGSIMKSGGRGKPRKLKPGYSFFQGSYYRTVMYGGILRRVRVIFEEVTK